MSRTVDLRELAVDRGVPGAALAPKRRFVSRIVVPAGLIVGLSAWAVARQLGTDPLEAYEAAAIRTLEVGEALPADVVIRDIGEESRPIGDWFGRTATVFYSWGTNCPCVPICETRMREAVNLDSRTYGLSLVNAYAAKVSASGALPNAYGRAVAGELRTTMAFVRNEFAHQVADIPRPRGLALVARMCRAVEIIEAMGPLA